MTPLILGGTQGFICGWAFNDLGAWSQGSKLARQRFGPGDNALLSNPSDTIFTQAFFNVYPAWGTFFAVASPVIDVPTLAQVHALVATTPVAVASPALDTLTIGYVFTGTGFAVNSLGFTNPTAANVFNLLASNAPINSPVLGTPAVQILKTDLTASNLAVAPLSFDIPTAIGVSWHTAVDTSINSPVLGTPTAAQLAPAADLMLSDRVIDNGLGVLSNETDKLIVLAMHPADYASAVAAALGEKALGTGNVFGAPVVAANGRKVISVQIIKGTVLAEGTPHRWAALDTVNSRLLADGILSGTDATVMDQTFSLTPITVVLPNAAA